MEGFPSETNEVIAPKIAMLTHCSVILGGQSYHVKRMFYDHSLLPGVKKLNSICSFFSANQPKFFKLNSRARIYGLQGHVPANIQQLLNFQQLF